MKMPLPAVPPPYATDDEPPPAVVDWERHDRLRAFLKAEFPRLRELYCLDASRWIAAIEDAVEARDAEALSRAAHTLQGDSYQFGAAALGHMAEALNQTVRSRSLDRSPPASIARAVSRLRPMLDKVVQQLEHADDRGAPAARGIAKGSIVRLRSPSR